MDYNAQRLARTSVTHAYQLSTERSTKDNPYVEEYEWLSSNDHTRICELCAERNHRHYKKGHVPLDHSNGMCTLIPVIDKSYDEMAEELKDWANGGENKKLDDWLLNGSPEYAQIRNSNAAGLPTKMERASVAGYHKVKTQGELKSKVKSTGKSVLNDQSSRFIEITDEAIERVPAIASSKYKNISPEALQEAHKELLRLAKDKNKSKEVTMAYSSDLTRKNTIMGSANKSSVSLYGLGENIFVMHNHPSGASYSVGDIIFLIDYEDVGALSIIKNNGRVELLEKTDKYERKRAKVLFERCLKKVDTQKKSEYTKVIKKYITISEKEGLLTWTKL